VAERSEGPGAGGLSSERGGLVLHGIDFSGGDRPEGKVWVATRDGRSIELRRGFDHRSIVELILASAADGRGHFWRIDAPFGLPLETLDGFGIGRTWSAMADWLGSFSSAREWRSACRERSRREPRRGTDLSARTPMSPLNLRVFKQSWSVITRVLKPLADAGIRIAPIVGPADGRVVVAEGCPASALHRRGWPARGYKGGGDGSDDPPLRRRRELVERMRGEGLALPTPMIDRVIADRDGDGLDALLLLLDPTQDIPPQEAECEAWVY
jgi:hypothetical protein